MRRKLFTLCWAVSLLLCLATVTLWVRSYWVGEMATHDTGSRRIVLRSSMGQCSVQRETAAAARFGEDYAGPGLGWTYYGSGAWSGLRTRGAGYRSTPGVVCYGPVLGFGLFTRTATRAGPDGDLSGLVEVFVPYWFVAGALAAAPLGGWVRWSRRRRQALRQARGLCLFCGYDLRATRGRCPECGGIVDAAETAA